jgi:hypothetical protein
MSAAPPPDGWRPLWAWIRADRARTRRFWVLAALTAACVALCAAVVVATVSVALSVLVGPS